MTDASADALRVVATIPTDPAKSSEVAAALSRRLHWALLDNAFIERVAVGLHITPAHVQAIEERRPSLAERK